MEGRQRVGGSFTPSLIRMRDMAQSDGIGGRKRNVISTSPCQRPKRAFRGEGDGARAHIVSCKRDCRQPESRSLRDQSAEQVGRVLHENDLRARVSFIQPTEIRDIRRGAIGVPCARARARETIFAFRADLSYSFAFVLNLTRIHSRDVYYNTKIVVTLYLIEEY